MKKLVLLSLSALLVTACATDPMTGQSTMSNTGKGAGIGAAIGAGAGTLFGGNDLENAGWGALAGGAVGAAVGAYMDSQQEEMQQSLQGTGIQVKRTAKNKLNLTMPSNITFGFDSATLTPQAQQALNSVGRVLNKYPASQIAITGHTDDTGSDSYNLKLSQERASSVASYLAQSGVAMGRMNTSGMGESQPKVPNTSEANRAQNRRVELTILANNNAGGGMQQQPGNYLQQPGGQQKPFRQQKRQMRQQMQQQYYNQ